MSFRILTGITILGLSTVVFSFAYALPSGTGVYSAVAPSAGDITVGFVGDMVPSIDAVYNHSVFSSVESILSKPDLMIGNLEGTFASADRTSKCIYIMTNCYAFRGDSSFAEGLYTAGFDFVSLVNNHSYDFGEDGLKDTITELDRIGMPYIAPTKPTASITIKGKRIGILGLSSTEPLRTITDYDFIIRKVTELKKNNDFVIVIFHGGSEGADKTLVPDMTEYMGTEDRGNVSLVAHTAIDAGADLVLGSGPHVLRKIETYKGKMIAYSLGNFVGGNGALATTGLLGISGMVTSTLSLNHASAPTFTSVLLSTNGIPSLDPLEQGKQLINSLSQ